MRHIPIFFLLISIFSSCGSNVQVVKSDKFQYRRTLKDDVRQLNFDLILELSKSSASLDVSELDITVNDTYLGKAVIGGASEPIPTQRYSLPVRVTFPADILVISDQNDVEVKGYLMLDGKKKDILYTEKAVYINNMTAL